MSNKQPISTFLGIAAAVVLAANSHAAIINVPGAHLSIQGGIDIAVDGDEVVVAIGTYSETINFNGKAITVRSTDPNDAGVVLNTIINGLGAGTVVTCNSGEGSDTVLSGFVITGGFAAFGGGMRNSNSSPTVTNCSFIGNTATCCGGGGMGNFSTSSPTVTNCSFIGNSGTGGGMLNDNSSPTVTNCTFSGNTSTSSGGGMVNNTNSSPTVTNCSFRGNTADVGGGGMYNNSSSPTVTNCSFSGNTANGSGGGMYNTSSSSPTMTNCSFSGNTADFGGGMFNNVTSPTVTNGSFIGNTANVLGGGMFNLGSSPTVTNTGFCDNTPDQINGTFTDGGGNSLLYCPPPIPKANPCPTDTNGDGVTNVLDLIELLLAFGTACP